MKLYEFYMSPNKIHKIQIFKANNFRKIQLDIELQVAFREIIVYITFSFLQSINNILICTKKNISKTN